MFWTCILSTKRWNLKYLHQDGTSLPLKSHIVLSPKVADRFGAQWHKYPLLTNDFESQFRIVTKSPSSGDPKAEQGFAFWYVYENVTATMPEDLGHTATDVSIRMASHGWGLYGYRNSFNGLGVFFANNQKSPTPEGGIELKPSVSVAVNDGTRSLVPPRDIPTPHGSYWNFRNNKLDVRVRVRPTSITVEAKPESRNDWVKLVDFSDPKIGRIQAGGYIGLTSSVGVVAPGTPLWDTCDQITIEDFTVRNYDTSQKGEEKVVAPPPPATASSTASKQGTGVGAVTGRHEEFLHDMSEEGVERAEGRAIKALSRMIFKLISETEPLKKSLAAAVETLTMKLNAMELSVKDLKEQILSSSGTDMDAQYTSMKRELAALTEKAVNDNAMKKDQLDKLNSELADTLDKRNAKGSAASVVKTLAEVDSRARDLKDAVASRGSTTIIFALVCIALVVIAGLVLQAKLKRWEKKHLL